MKMILIILVVIGVLVGGFFWFNSYIYNEKQGEGLPPEPIRVALEGEYVCLPQKEDTIATADCAIGLHTQTGEYYALDFGLLSQTPPSLVDGDRLSASGVLTPIETLSTDYWHKYPVVGIFSVTDSLQKLEKEIVEPLSSSTLFSSWNWKYTDLNNGTKRTAPQGDLYVLSLASTSAYRSTTDCNALSGTFVVDVEVLSFGPAVSTKMFCEGSEETEYARELGLTNSYTLVGNELHFNLNRDYGVMVFELMEADINLDEPTLAI